MWLEIVHRVFLNYPTDVPAVSLLFYQGFVRA